MTSRRSMMRAPVPTAQKGLAMHLRGRLFSAPLEVLSVEGEEGINALYRFRVQFTADPRDDLTGDRALLHMPVELTLGASGERHVHGIVTELSAEAGLVGQRPIYRIAIEPRAALLTRRTHSRIFHDQSIVDIVSALLHEHRVVFRKRLVSVYDKRAHSVQYDESDWDFCTRLLAEAGIFYFFDHPAAQGDAIETGMGHSEVLVLCDTAQYYPPIAGNPELLVRSRSGALALDDSSVLELSLQHEAGTTVRLTRAFDFARPTTELKDSQHVESGEEPALVYTFGGEGDESPPEVAHAKTRLEQDRAQVTVARGRSVCARVVPGRTFAVRQHHVPSCDGSYVAISVQHRAWAPSVCPPDTHSYENVWRAVPATTAARPPAPRLRPRHATETATVIGPPGAEQHVDAQGRIKVRFHWDLQGKTEEECSCWVRVAQALAGSGWGSQLIPRVGMEVVVTFLGGDLDRPLITHAVYNGTHPWPFPLPQQVTKSGLRTASTPQAQGFHEISMDDAAGRELLFIHAQRDARRIVRQDDDEAIGRDQRERVGRDRVTEVARHDATTVGQSQTAGVGGTQTGTHMSDGKISLTTGAATLTLDGADATLSANGKIDLTAGGSISCTSETAIHLKAPLVVIHASVLTASADTSAVVAAGGGLVLKGGVVTVVGGVITEN